MTTSPGPPIRSADDPDTLTISGRTGPPRTVTRRAGPLADLLDDLHPEGDHATVHSGDGLFRASIPLATLRTGRLSEKGRLELDDSPTKCWLVKDVRVIEITAGRRPDSLPAEERAKT